MLAFLCRSFSVDSSSTWIKWIAKKKAKQNKTKRYNLKTSDTDKQGKNKEKETEENYNKFLFILMREKLLLFMMRDLIRKCKEKQNENNDENAAIFF